MLLLLTNTICSVHNANVTQLVVVQQLSHYVQVANNLQPIWTVESEFLGSRRNAGDLPFMRTL